LPAEKGPAAREVLMTLEPILQDVVAVVGAGKGGLSLLEMLCDMPIIEMRYVYDPDPEAPGMRFARSRGIECLTDMTFPELTDNEEINLILEITGLPEVFEQLDRLKSAHTSLIGAEGNRVVFAALETQERDRRNLEELRMTLEERVAKRTEEYKEANRQLEELLGRTKALNEKLQQINEEKTRYLLRSTHQLKAPFAAIQSYVDLILDGYTGEVPQKTHDIAAKVKERCDLLSNSIKEMLELANLRSCVAENLDLTHRDLNQAIGTVVEANRVVAEGVGVSIRFAPLAGSCMVTCHRGQMVTLFSTLIENAIDYSPPDSEILVTVVDENGHVMVSVRDQGIGISEENLPRVFEEYFRANEAVAKHKNGTGLGLSIAREIAAIHGFAREAQSRQGEGTVFTVRIPREK